MNKVLEIWSDVDNKLAIDTTGDVKKDVNLDALKCAIENILLTRKGERVMRPDFGSALEYFLYEPVGEATAHKIGLEVLSALKQEKRIQVTNVEISVNEAISAYEIRIEAQVVGLNKTLVYEKVLLV
jgi:hypothetical protein